ncbi:hypothetical protein CLOM_g15747 [Closterium sp. NIES-68]|nr:hypothetical protein CLOM_g15747 [Closterium sp. NIES-68]
MTILVVIDKFSKMGHFIPTHTTARTEETAQLFVRYIISQHGIPTTLISDRDPKFTSKFWKELMSLSDQTRHVIRLPSQTNGQTERLNQIVEQLLRAACKDEISKWDLHLPVLEFAYNNATHADWTDAVLPLLRTPPTHTSTANHTSHSHSYYLLLTPASYLEDSQRLPCLTLETLPRSQHALLWTPTAAARHSSSSMMNPSTRSSPCLLTAVDGMAPWSFSSVGRVMILQRIAGSLNPRWTTLIVLFATTFLA